MKSETRNPKSERNPNREIRTRELASGILLAVKHGWQIYSGLRPSDFFRISRLRFSDFRLLFALLLLPALVHATPASALRDYQSGNFTNALTEFTRLSEVQTNDLRLVFNAGDAAYRATNFDLAQSLFSQVVISPDIKLQEQAYYNLGNVQFQKAKLAKDLDGLEQGFVVATNTYARAVSLNTNDLDAVYNLQFTMNTVAQIQQFKAAMRRAKSEADNAVRQAEFHRALEIMAPLQKTVAAKQFEDFTKKLKDIDDIANPHQP